MLVWRMTPISRRATLKLPMALAVIDPPLDAIRISWNAAIACCWSSLARGQSPCAGSGVDGHVDVGDHAGEPEHAARAANQQRRVEKMLGAGERTEVGHVLGGQHHLAKARQVAAGVLDAEHQAFFGQRAHQCGGQLDLDGARDVVGRQREIDALLHVAVVGRQLRLRVQEVVRRGGHQGVGARGMRLAPEGDALGRAGVADADHDRRPAPGGLDGRAHHAQLLFVRQQRAFARRAQHQQRVDARCNLKVDQRVNAGLVDVAVLVERSDQARG